MNMEFAASQGNILIFIIKKNFAYANDFLILPKKKKYVSQAPPTSLTNFYYISSIYIEKIIHTSRISYQFSHHFPCLYMVTWLNPLHSLVIRHLKLKVGKVKK